MKFADFQIVTRSRPMHSAITNPHDFAELALGLLEDNMPLPKPVRLLGGRCLPSKPGMTRCRNWISGFDRD
ncbi:MULTISPECIES: hypothetical protein [Bradyrhizobium]|uniref:DinB/UmuC family translesion DNA polymerase n=1 Tax=Bradyrhizobium TaxID=374 RepID=UPI0021698145|nr:MULTISPECIES: hypothetical protein [Bradyrhizobium]